MHRNGSFCYALVICFLAGLTAASTAHAFEDKFEKLVVHAKQKAAQPFHRTKKIPNADFDFGNPPEARGLVFSEALKISSKAPIVENEGTGLTAYPRRGTAWEKCRIFFQSEKGKPFVEHQYSPELVSYDSTEIRPPLPTTIPKAVQHWTEVGVFASVDGGFPQLVNMRANGYMRIASPGCVYGHSERALIEQESLDNRPENRRRIREKFPLMTHAYFEYPSYRKCLVYQIYENETAVLARRLEIEMGDQTIIRVLGVLLPRQKQSFNANQNIGMAHISMYWKGAREGAAAGEHAHDSDTVVVDYEDGDSRVFPIPASPKRTDENHFLFVDLESGKKISGYSLEQRDRNKSNYVPGVEYHKRASMKITELDWSVPTTTQLVMLPHDGEFFDNVVLRTVIRPAAASVEPIKFSYVETVGAF